MGKSRRYSYYNIICICRYRINTNTLVGRYIIPFVGMKLFRTYMNCLFLTQVQEIIPSFVLRCTLMSVFDTLGKWLYESWSYSLLTISKSLSLIFWSSHGDKFFHSLTLSIYISPCWGEVCLSPENITTFFHRNYLPVIIPLYILLMNIMFLVFTSHSRYWRYTGG